MSTQLINPVKNGRVRRSDKWGEGKFGASRKSRIHKGIDIVTIHHQDIYSPISGKVVRKAFPYANDLTYSGILIEGTGVHKTITVKIFYIHPIHSVIGSHVSSGTKIGTAQDLTRKYPGIFNHIHLEVKKNGMIVNPNIMIPGIR